MQHFLQIAAGIDTTPTLNALAANRSLWNEHDLRTAFAGSPHEQADDIWLLFNRVPVNPAEVIDDITVEPYRGWWALPALRGLVLDLLRRVDGIALGRVVVTRLKPGAKIAAHRDEGAPAEYFTRYQIVLQSLPGAVFRINQESVSFRTGDAWMIDNRSEHEVINNSADVATVGSAIATTSATNKASKTAQQTAANNNALQQQVYAENKATLSPYVGNGNAAGTAINSLLGLSGDATPANAAFDAYKGSTEYQSRLAQGQNSVTAALGSKGLLDSGAALKSLTKYGQTAASAEFGNYLGNLQTQQQTGLSAASALAGVGQNYATGVSSNNNAAASAATTAALSNANTVNGALGNLVSAYGISQGLGSSYGSKSSATGALTGGYDPNYNYALGG